VPDGHSLGAKHIVESKHTDQASPEIVLASASPRRRELLRRLVRDFVVIPPEIDEEALEGTPEQVSRELARRKAVVVGVARPEAYIVAADTVIDLDGRLLGKPRDAADALAMLRALAGREHRVISAVTVRAPRFAPGKDKVTEFTSVVTSEVRMKAVVDDVVENYVASGEPLDKAGGYAIQGKGAQLVDGFEGCYNNIIGLPLCEVVRLLTLCGWPQPLPAEACRGKDGSPCPRLAERRTSDRRFRTMTPGG